MKRFDLNIFTDGGARGNPGPAAVGVVIKGKDNKLIHQFGEYIGESTNNHAEYQGVIAALKWLIANPKTVKPLNQGSCRFFLDATLVVNQLNGLFKIKNANLRQQLIQVRELEASLPLEFIYQAVPRTKNARADFLLNQILDQHH